MRDDNLFSVSTDLGIGHVGYSNAVLGLARIAMDKLPDEVQKFMAEGLPKLEENFDTLDTQHSDLAAEVIRLNQMLGNLFELRLIDNRIKQRKEFMQRWVSSNFESDVLEAMWQRHLENERKQT